MTNDLQCNWGIVRTDAHEFVTDEYCTLPELLEQVTELVKQWDDPAEDPPELVLYRCTPEERAAREAHAKQFLQMLKQ